MSHHHWHGGGWLAAQRAAYRAAVRPSSVQTCAARGAVPAKPKMYSMPLASHQLITSGQASWLSPRRRMRTRLLVLADGRPPVSPGSGSRGRSCRCLPQHGQDQPAAGVEDMDRQKAPVIVIGIELAQFLLAMDPIKAFIKIKGQMAGDDRKAVAIQVEHRLGQAIEFRAPRHVLQAGDGRLRAERRPRTGGRSSAILKMGSSRSTSQSLPSG